MRMQPDKILWMQNLLEVRNGSLPQDETGRIILPPAILSTGDQEIFEESFNDSNFLIQRAIFCPKNKDVDRVNLNINHRLSINKQCYKLIDEKERSCKRTSLVCV